MEKGKGVSLINLILVIVIIIIGVILFKAITHSNSLEKIILTKDNFQTTMDEYSKQKKGSDDIVYIGYAIMYHSTIEYTSNAFSQGISEDVQYSNIYGKSLQELKEEGKSLMKKNNVTVEQFKKYMQ